MDTHSLLLQMYFHVRPINMEHDSHKVFRQSILKNIKAFEEIFINNKENLDERISIFVHYRREYVMKTLNKIYPVNDDAPPPPNVFTNEQIFSLIIILLESNLRAINPKSEELPRVKKQQLLESFSRSAGKKKKKEIDDDDHDDHDDHDDDLDSVSEFFSDCMNSTPYKFSEQITDDSNIMKVLRHFEGEKTTTTTYYKFWQFVSKILYQIMFSDDKHENLLSKLYYDLTGCTEDLPKTAMDLCLKILRFIIDNFQQSSSNTYHRFAILSIVDNSILIRSKLEILNAKEIFAKYLLNNNNSDIADSQQAALKLLHVMENLRDLTKPSSMLRKNILSKIILPKKYGKNKKRRKIEETEVIVLNSTIYSVALGSKCWQTGRVVDEIVKSVFEKEKNDKRLLSYILRCVALFQIAHQPKTEKKIGVWFNKLLMNYNRYFNNEGKFNFSMMDDEDDMAQSELKALFCGQRLLNAYIYYDNNDNDNFDNCNQLFNFISQGWLNSKFTTSEIGCSILASVLSNKVLSTLLDNDILLERFINGYPRYALCDDDSFALSDLFIPITAAENNNNWENARDNFDYPIDCDDDDLMVAFSPGTGSHRTVYIKIDSREKMVKWAIAVMLRNAYYLLYHRYRNNKNEYDILQYDLRQCYRKQFILRLDLIIDPHSGYPCVRIDKLAEYRSLSPLDDISDLERENQPVYHYLGAMISIYLKMVSGIPNYDVQIRNIQNCCISATNYVEDHISLFFTPPLPTRKSISIRSHCNYDENKNIFNRIKKIIKNNTGSQFCDKDSLGAVEPFMKDKYVISQGRNFINNCLMFFR